MVLEAETLNPDTFVRLREISESLTSAEKKVADFIVLHREEVIRMSITDLAVKSQGSESTIVRLCKKLRLRGYQELRVALAQAAVQPAVKQIHEKVTLEDRPEQTMRKVFQAAAQALSDTESILSNEHLNNTIDFLKNAASITFFGIGASGVIALDAFYRFSKLGIPCHVATDGHSQMNKAILLNERDVVIGISHSGRTLDVLRALDLAKNRGAKVVAITQFGHSPITEIANAVLFTSSRETAFRTEAMASRVAQNVILDALFVSVSLTRYEEVIKNYELTRTYTSDMRVDNIRSLRKKTDSIQ